MAYRTTQSKAASPGCFNSGSDATDRSSDRSIIHPARAQHECKMLIGPEDAHAFWVSVFGGVEHLLHRGWPGVRAAATVCGPSVPLCALVGIIVATLTDCLGTTLTADDLDRKCCGKLRYFFRV